MVNGKFYFKKNVDDLFCIDSEAEVETGMLDFVSDSNPRVIKKDDKPFLGVRNDSQIYAFGEGKVKWETPKEWTVVVAEYPGKKKTFFWENSDKVVVLHEGTYSCLDRETGKELWNFKTEAAKFITIDGNNLVFIDGGTKEVALNLTDGTTKVKEIDMGKDIVIYEGDCKPPNRINNRDIMLLKPGVYLIVKNYVFRTPHQYCYYVCDLNNKTCTIEDPSDKVYLSRQKMLNQNNKYYMIFDYVEMYRGDDKKYEYVKVFEADTETGTTKEIKKNEIPANAKEITIDGSCLGDLIWDSFSSPQKDVSQKEIADKTGIKKHPAEKEENRIVSDSEVVGSVVGKYVVVSRKINYHLVDGSDSTYDLLAVFEKGTWKKVWETADFPNYKIIGPLVFVEGKGITDIATGKNYSPYSEITLFGSINDKLFLYAQKDGKPKIVVMNLKKIEEL